MVTLAEGVHSTSTSFIQHHELRTDSLVWLVEPVSTIGYEPLLVSFRSITAKIVKLDPIIFSVGGGLNE